MKHLPSPTRRALALLAPMLLALASVAAAQTPVPSPTANPVHQCAGRINTLVREYTSDYLQIVTTCEVSRLHTGSPANCSTDNDTLKAIDNLADGLAGEIASGCTPEAQDALCPLGADIPIEFPEVVATPTGDSLRARLMELVADLFTTPLGGCTRPAPGTITTGVKDCAARIGDAVTDTLVEPLEAEFFNCERDRILFPGHEICVDDITGEPSSAGLIADQEGVLSEVENVEVKCDAAKLSSLGCPLGASTIAAFESALRNRVAALVQQLNLDIYHSECQGPRPGEPTEPVPANVTLLPSGIQKQLNCGDTIDDAFMEGNNEVAFDSDLDCGPAQAPEDGSPIDGIVVAKSRIRLNGRVGKVWSIRGPQRSSLRTGVGIRLLPNARRVDIRNFKAIENFAVGIQDADDGTNRKLAIHKTTVRRNREAGLRIRSPRAVIDQVVADKNGIGMDLSGDGVKVKNGSQAKGSLYPPMTGIQLSGIDRNADGRIVVVSSGASSPNVVELNRGIGIHVLEGAHVVVGAQVRSNVGDGIVIEPLGVGTKIDTNTVKLNQNGIVVRGDSNIIDTNLCEENLGDGFVIESVMLGDGTTIGGADNTLLNNSSGKKTDRGNGGAGYRIGGSGTTVDTNEAEANVGAGFVVTGPTALFKGSNAQSNFGSGFDIQSTGNTFEACAAEANNQAEDPAFHEWVFVAGQTDNDGNKAGGDTIQLPATAGFCDVEDDCPVPR
ncbi:MAG: right-handed parallel beta-helix repeat-containing protein [Thermodesulfobacteriota bacterium]